MKRLPLVLAIAFVGAPGVGVAAQYVDTPSTVTEKSLEIVNRYSEQARRELPRFEAEMAKPAAGRKFYVATRLREGTKSEQVFVSVDSRKGTDYVGRIESAPTGLIAFKRGDAITVAVKDVFDWLILLPDGEEVGNLTGKALDALRDQIVAFLIAMTPEKGVFAKFRVDGVINARTQQPIRELVPDEVIARVETEAKVRWDQLKVEDEKAKFQFVLVSFPEWKIFPPEAAPSPPFSIGK